MDGLPAQDQTGPNGRSATGWLRRSDGSRFADGDKLAFYAGLAPVTRQCGKSITASPRADEATTA
jgi:hypothetical protein